MRYPGAGLRQILPHPLAVLMVSTLTISACASDPAGPVPGEPVQAIPAQRPAATQPSVAAVIPGVAIERLRDEAARAACMPLDSVRMLESEAVTWPDSGLGCSVPDESTLQVLTPG